MVVLNNIIFLLLGGALTELGRWIDYRRKTAIELRERSWEKADAFDLCPRAWDHLFSKGDCHWLLLTLKDGTKIGGYFGTQSFVSSYPHDDDIYMEDSWNISDGETFENHVNKGILVERNNISYIQVYEVCMLEDRR